VPRVSNLTSRISHYIINGEEQPKSASRITNPKKLSLRTSNILDAKLLATMCNQSPTGQIPPSSKTLKYMKFKFQENLAHKGSQILNSNSISNFEKFQ
jgi:hypothetical protein